MLVGEIFKKRPHTSDRDVASIREQVLSEYFPPFGDLEQSIIVKKAGEVVKEMIWLHALIKTNFNTDHEIWMIAKWLYEHRQIKYTFVNRLCSNNQVEKFDQLAAFLGTDIYKWCKGTEPPSGRSTITYQGYEVPLPPAFSTKAAFIAMFGEDGLIQYCEAYIKKLGVTNTSSK